MYPWFRVMYAVVQIGSMFFRSACGITRRTEPAALAALGSDATKGAAIAPPTKARRLNFIPVLLAS
jgi:hypothetical protein